MTQFLFHRNRLAVRYCLPDFCVNHPSRCHPRRSPSPGGPCEVIGAMSPLFRCQPSRFSGATVLLDGGFSMMHCAHCRGCGDDCDFVVGVALKRFSRYGTKGTHSPRSLSAVFVALPSAISSGFLSFRVPTIVRQSPLLVSLISVLHATCVALDQFSSAIGVCTF